MAAGCSRSVPATSPGGRRAGRGNEELLRLTVGSDPAAVWLATTDADTWCRRTGCGASSTTRTRAGTSPSAPSPTGTAIRRTCRPRSPNATPSVPGRTLIAAPFRALPFSGLIRLQQSPDLSSGECLTADGREYLSGVVAGQSPAGEEDIRGGDLVGVGGPAHGHLLAERADPVRVEGREDQRGPDRAGGDAVYADAAVLQCLGQ